MDKRFDRGNRGHGHNRYAPPFSGERFLFRILRTANLHSPCLSSAGPRRTWHTPHTRARRSNSAWPRRRMARTRDPDQVDFGVEPSRSGRILRLRATLLAGPPGWSFDPRLRRRAAEALRPVAPPPISCCKDRSSTDSPASSRSMASSCRAHLVARNRRAGRELACGLRRGKARDARRAASKFAPRRRAVDMKRRFVVVDQNAVSAEGHFKMYSSSVALAAHQAGHEVAIR